MDRITVSYAKTKTSLDTALKELSKSKEALELNEINEAKALIDELDKTRKELEKLTSVGTKEIEKALIEAQRIVQTRCKTERIDELLEKSNDWIARLGDIANTAKGISSLAN